MHSNADIFWMRFWKWSSIVLGVCILLVVAASILDSFLPETNAVREELKAIKKLFENFTIVGLFSILTLFAGFAASQASRLKERIERKDREQQLETAATTAVKALFYGYRVNFLERLADGVLEEQSKSGNNYKIAIIKPSASAVRNYNLVDEVDRRLQPAGFKLEEVKGDKFGVRSIFMVYTAQVHDPSSKDQEVHVIVDFPTTLVSIMEAIEITTKSSAGESRSPEDENLRFEQLRDSFFNQLDEFSKNRWDDHQQQINTVVLREASNTSLDLLEQMGIEPDQPDQYE